MAERRRRLTAKGDDKGKEDVYWMALEVLVRTNHQETGHIAAVFYFIAILSTMNWTIFVTTSDVTYFWRCLIPNKLVVYRHLSETMFCKQALVEESHKFTLRNYIK